MESFANFDAVNFDTYSGTFYLYFISFSKRNVLSLNNPSKKITENGNVSNQNRAILLSILFEFIFLIISANSSNRPLSKSDFKIPPPPGFIPPVIPPRPIPSIPLSTPSSVPPTSNNYSAHSVQHAPATSLFSQASYIPPLPGNYSVHSAHNTPTTPFPPNNYSAHSVQHAPATSLFSQASCIPPPLDNYSVHSEHNTPITPFSQNSSYSTIHISSTSPFPHVPSVPSSYSVEHSIPISSTPSFVPPVISVLNPTPATTKPMPTYILSPSPTKSILRNHSNNNSLNKSNRVSFDLSGNLNRGLAPKSSNPSMPNLSKLTCNPFLDDNDYGIANTNLERSESTERLGVVFFASLITNDIPDPWSSPSVPPPAKSDPTPKSTITPGSTFKSG